MLQQVGRYQIQSEIARGGMAVVYHAFDPRFEREVAVKILPRFFLHDPTLRQRFEREAKTIAGLDHPAIVPVYDFGEEEEYLYLVMRYMAGGDLERRLEQGPLPLAEVEATIRRVGFALDEAHRRGIVHRDLKPSNILYDQYGDAYLSDFGIARLIEHGATLTGTGVIGTPGYMSPEQIHGRNLDGRSDIYSLGMILFQMLSGRPAFEGDTPAAVLARQLTEKPPDLAQLRPDLPAAYSRVVAAATAKEREERVRSGAQLTEMLQEAAQIRGAAEREVQRPQPAKGQAAAETVVLPEAQQEAPATPAPPGQPAPRPLQRPAPPFWQRLPRWLWALVALVGLLILLTLAALLQPDAPTPPEEPAASLATTIRDGWSEGFFVDSVAYGNGRWATILSDGGVEPRQIWQAESTFPASFVRQRWQQGYDVGEVAYGDNRWLVIMGQGEGQGQQVWQLQPDFPTDFIREKWAQGFDISDVAYGNRNWLVMMAAAAGEQQQVWQLQSTFPRDWVRAKWAEGFDITEVAYGRGNWLVVMAQSGGGQQVWQSAESFPQDYVRQKWSEGYELSEVAFGNGLWLVVLTRGGPALRQRWYLADEIETD